MLFVEGKRLGVLLLEDISDLFVDVAYEGPHVLGGRCMLDLLKVLVRKGETDDCLGLKVALALFGVERKVGSRRIIEKVGSASWRARTSWMRVFQVWKLSF